MITLKRKALRKNEVFSKKGISNNVIWGITYAFLALVCFFQVYIIFWMMYTSLKDDLMLYEDMFAFPPLKDLQWENYVTIFDRIQVKLFSANKGYVTYSFWDMVFNGAVLSFLMPISSIVSTVCTAYVISKFDFPGRKLLLNINLWVMIIPIVGNLASSLKINNLIGRYDNLLLMTILGGQPFGMNLLIYIGMFNRIDKEYAEAAKIDGAGELRIFLTIMLPMIKSTVFVFYILAVLGTWNNYELPLIWLPSYPNIAYGIHQFQYDAGKYGAILPEVLAGFVIISIPSVVFFGMNQKLIASKMVVGGLKG